MRPLCRSWITPKSGGNATFRMQATGNNQRGRRSSSSTGTQHEFFLYRGAVPLLADVRWNGTPLPVHTRAHNQRQSSEHMRKWNEAERCWLTKCQWKIDFNDGEMLVAGQREGTFISSLDGGWFFSDGTSHQHHQLLTCSSRMSR